VGVTDAVPVNLTSSKRNETELLLLNRKRKFEVAGIDPVAVLAVHVLAVIVELTVNAVYDVPSVLYSTTNILLAVDASTPKLKLIEVNEDVLIPEIRNSLALPPAVPKKIFPPPLAPVLLDAVVFRTSAVPLNVIGELFWKVFDAIAVVADGVPIFSDNMVVCAKPKTEKHIIKMVCIKRKLKRFARTTLTAETALRTIDTLVALVENE
jgi:hypothetical protein